MHVGGPDELPSLSPPHPLPLPPINATHSAGVLVRLPTFSTFLANDAMLAGTGPHTERERRVGTTANGTIGRQVLGTQCVCRWWVLCRCWASCGPRVGDGQFLLKMQSRSGWHVHKQLQALVDVSYVHVYNYINAYYGVTQCT